jgi:hypothetical protein
MEHTQMEDLIEGASFCIVETIEDLIVHEPLYVLRGTTARTTVPSR